MSATPTGPIAIAPAANGVERAQPALAGAAPTSPCIAPAKPASVGAPPAVILAPAAAAPLARAGWHASLDLEFAARAGRTYLARRAHVGPLVVQRPFYPEGSVCHAYVVHPPGGIVGSDRLELNVLARPGSHALLTTPAATKFYGNSGHRAEQTQTFKLEQASLEWLPQETILYPQASARVSTRVQLCKHSRFMGWEVICFGRPASGMAYAQGLLAQDFELWLDEAPLLLDRLRIDGATAPMHAPYGLAGQPVMATLLAYPANAALLELIRDSSSTPPMQFACTHVDGVLVARVVGRHVDHVRAVMESVWRRLRPEVIGRDAVAPRIWST